MNNEQLESLTRKIDRLKSARKFAECIEEVNLLEREDKHPNLRVILAITKASCALALGDLSLAKNAISRLQALSLSPVEEIYRNLVVATIMHEDGKTAEADAVLSINLARKDLYNSEYREALYETLARKGFACADLNRFDTALGFLDQSLGTLPNGEFHDNILLYQGYCLQALGKLDQAEKSLERGIAEGSGDLAADIFYRLGAVRFQKHNYKAAIEAFTNAERNVPHGRVGLGDILSALSEVYRESGDVEMAEQYHKRAQLASTVQ
jgi:tetratricopeptide (TPR) repeat protein